MQTFKSSCPICSDGISVVGERCTSCGSVVHRPLRNWLFDFRKAQMPQKQKVVGLMLYAYLPSDTFNPMAFAMNCGINNRELKFALKALERNKWIEHEFEDGKLVTRLNTWKRD
jgi:hypothetical protein